MGPLVGALVAVAAVAHAAGAITGAPPAAAPSAAAQVIDDFESAAAWKAVPADGVEMRLSTDAGERGRSLRVDFKFVKGGGYAVLHRDLSLELPENYRFSFALRGACRPNNLEFKLVDSTGANVWWCNRRNVEFPVHWTEQAIKKRHISFAWGPVGGGEIRHVASLEFAVTAGSGGEGTVWLDDLELTPLSPPGGSPPPIRAIGTSERAGRLAARAVDGDTATYWASGARDRRPYLEFDLGQEREFGGIELDWVPGLHARTYVIEVATRRGEWKAVRTVVNGNGGRDRLRLPESEARWVRLRVLRPAVFGEVGLRELTIMPLEWGATLESFYEAIAKESPRGSYPRGLSGEQVYWTVVGADRDTLEALLDEDGNLEAGSRRWMIQPFVEVDGRLVTWADVRAEQNMWPGYRDVTWYSREGFRLETTALALADSASLPPESPPSTRSLGGSRPRLFASYRLSNGTHAQTLRFFLAIRPFQVNPPGQFLNQPGGVGGIQTIERAGDIVHVDGGGGILSLKAPSGFGAATSDEGDVSEYLRAGRLPSRQRVSDPQRLASAVLEYRVELPALSETTLTLVIPLHEPVSGLGRLGGRLSPERVSRAAEWATATTASNHFRVPITVYGQSVTDSLLHRYVRSIWATLDYILVNRDGAAIQPGSRAYSRSWIRDGSLTSSALLRLGQHDVVREYIEWFAPYQYADGKVPCCVDARGSDPVPEHDSHGEFIFLVADYVRYTHDRALAERMWPHVRAAAAAIDSLRRERRGPDWLTPDKRRYFGLLPPSISHEGYSAKPMHSYWDDLFALRGLRDVTYLAGVLGLESERAHWARVRDEFQVDLAASVRAAMADHHIDYVPGCADLGDFDATSTTIALDPVQADDVVPRAALERTFERYWQFFVDRRDGKNDWEAYTPYELRNVGAFVRLGWRERALDLLDYFFQGQRPPEWAQWPEVVWKDARAPHFLGDLPHTWVGSDFLRSALDMLAYARERDDALVVGAGLPWRWVEGKGCRVDALATPWGPLGFTMSSAGDTLEAKLEAGLDVPPGGIVVSPPARRPFRSATVNGAPAALTRAGEVVVRQVPATVVFAP